MIEISLRSVLINNSAVAKHTLDWEETYYLSEVTSGEIIMYHLQTKSGESDGPLTPYSIMAPIIILFCFIQWGLCCLIEGKMNKNKNKKYENGDHFGIRCIKINGFWLWRTLFFGSIQNMVSWYFITSIMCPPYFGASLLTINGTLDILSIPPATITSWKKKNTWYRHPHSA